MRKWAERKMPNGYILGEVSNADTLNYRSFQPERGGLFCQEIFGPVTSWMCECRKYSGILLEKICEDCAVELTETRVRRYRMGFVNLGVPIPHFWYFSGTPNYLLMILSVLFAGSEEDGEERFKKSHIEEVIYYANGADNINDTNLFYPYTIYDDKMDYKDLMKLDITSYLVRLNRGFRRGGDVIIESLKDIDMESSILSIRALIGEGGRNMPSHPIRKIRIFENFLATKTELSSIVLTVIPILPPTLRPLVEVQDSRLVSADANELYRMLLIRNYRAYSAIYLDFMPDLVTCQSRKLLQEAVDCLIDNARVAPNKVYTVNDRALKGLTEALEGKQGRFRQNLLGKRTDYSARSVIVVGPGLRLNQCGLPYEIAVKLFYIHLNKMLMDILPEKLQRTQIVNKFIKGKKIFVWRLLEILLNQNTILLNRAPTLHKFGIQAFNPILILGQAIQLHPLVCTGFNADFDGDQMAVHLPLTVRAQFEAEALMRPSSNILSPANGEVILKPSQDMVIGSYYLTLMLKSKESTIKGYFGSEQAALDSYYGQKIPLHQKILVKYDLKNRLRFKKNELIIAQEIESLSKSKIKIFKVLKARKNAEKLYLITNLGLIVAYHISEDFYVLKELYLETTVGRLVFTDTLKLALEKANLDE